MVFTYTEKELREFNIGDNVYSVNPDYAEKNHSTVITDLPQKDNEQILLQQKIEKNLRY